jgi:hypothetical protein
MPAGLLQGHHKSLLDPVVRQHHSLQRAGSEMSSLSNVSPSDGSAADLQALLASSAAAVGSMAGSPAPNAGMGSPAVAASEPALAAAMAGLQLGMGMGMQGMAGPSCFPQMPFNPWMTRVAAGYGAPQNPDPYQMLLQQQMQQQAQQQQQQQQGSRLQHMTGPYPTPMQQAMLMNNAAHLLR